MAAAACLALASAVGMPRAAVPAVPGADKTGAAAASMPSATATRHSRTRCANCGTIESIRPVADAGDGRMTYEFTVRMYDGSTRVSTETSARRWHAGDRVVLITGARAAPSH